MDWNNSTHLLAMLYHCSILIFHSEQDAMHRVLPLPDLGQTMIQDWGQQIFTIIAVAAVTPQPPMLPFWFHQPSHKNIQQRTL
jgi:hypothetical protein